MTRTVPQDAALGVREPMMAALVLVTGIGPLATDMYLAALPAVGRTLHTSGTIAQLMMTAFIVGLAVGQLVIGPLSDALGRRTPMLVGTVAFAVFSALCAVAPNGAVLLVARLGEGIAGGCGVAIGRAIVSDRFKGSAAASRFGTLTAVTLLGPVIAPAIGGAILQLWSWRAIFVVLTVIGVAMTTLVWIGVPETLPAEERHEPHFGATARRMRDLWLRRSFRAPVVVQCLATAGFFVYIGGSSIVLQQDVGISAGRYALLFATNATAMACASLLFRLTVARTGPAPLRRAGLLISTAGAGTLLAYAVLAGHVTIVPSWILLAIMVAGNGLTIPATTAIAQEAGRSASGTASALQGGLTFIVGSLATPLTGITGRETVVAMSACISVLFIAALVALAAYRDERAVPAGG